MGEKKITMLLNIYERKLKYYVCRKTKNLLNATTTTTADIILL